MANYIIGRSASGISTKHDTCFALVMVMIFRPLVNALHKVVNLVQKWIFSYSFPPATGSNQAKRRLAGWLSKFSLRQHRRVIENNNKFQKHGIGMHSNTKLIIFAALARLLYIRAVSLRVCGYLLITQMPYTIQKEIQFPTFPPRRRSIAVCRCKYPQMNLSSSFLLYQLPPFYSTCLTNLPASPRGTRAPSSSPWAVAPRARGSDRSPRAPRGAGCPRA